MKLVSALRKESRELFKKSRQYRRWSAQQMARGFFAGAQSDLVIAMQLDGRARGLLMAIDVLQRERAREKANR